MVKPIDVQALVGLTFDKWEVLTYSHLEKSARLYNCICSCGTLRLISRERLLKGKATQCIKCCLTYRNKEVLATHNQTKTRIYQQWSGLKRRIKDTDKNYLGLGIKICKEWFDSFETYRDWAMANGYTDSLTVERKDVLGNYEPSNCTFVTNKKQQANKLNTIRLPDGSMAWDLAQENGITRSAFDKRLKLGWDLMKICTTPLDNSKNSWINRTKA